MARSVPEWVGRTDDSMPGKNVRNRISLRTGDACAECKKAFGPTNRPHCDHVLALADGGENREGNLQMLCTDCHKAKTSLEAAARAKTRSIRSKHLGLDKAINAPQPGSLPGTRIKYSRARGCFYDRFTGEVIEEQHHDQ